MQEASSTQFTTHAIFTLKQSGHKHNFCFYIVYNLSMVHFNVMKHYIGRIRVKTRLTFHPFYFVIWVKCSPPEECISKDAKAFKIIRKKF